MAGEERIFRGRDCKTYITTSGDAFTDHKVLVCEIDDRSYSINAEWIPKKDLTWFARAYSSILMEMRKNTRENTFKEINSKVSGLVKYLKDNKVI